MFYKKVPKNDISKVNQPDANADLYVETASEVGCSVDMVKEVIDAQSKFIKQTIKEGAFDGVAMPYLGKICAKPKKIQHLNNRS